MNHPLREGISVGKLRLANRLVLPPMATEKSDACGHVTDALIAHYDEKTQGGYIGLAIVEHAFVRPDGRASKRQLSIAEDGCIPGLSRLVETLHRNNTPAFAQIAHAGGKARREISGLQAAAPSEVRIPGTVEGLPLPHALTLAEISEIRHAFTCAAVRAAKAGFDGVELHSAHGYLLNQFLSPLSNRREDAYGGSLENRIRLHLEIIRDIRDALGADYPIAVRIGACDYMPSGTEIADSVRACMEFARAGVCLADVSGGFCVYKHPNSTAQGFFAELSEPIRAAVDIPVILTGGIADARAANELLAAGKADLIGVGRAILTDSTWPRRAMEA